MELIEKIIRVSIETETLMGNKSMVIQYFHSDKTISIVGADKVNKYLTGFKKAGYIGVYKQVDETGEYEIWVKKGIKE